MFRIYTIKKKLKKFWIWDCQIDWFFQQTKKMAFILIKD